MLEEERKEAPKKKEDKSEVWRVKQKDDDRQGPGSSAAPVYMVFMLPNSSWHQTVMMKDEVWKKLWLN